MTDETTKKIKSAIRALGASRYKKSVPWKGYEVYKPVYTEFAFRGFISLSIQSSHLEDIHMLSLSRATV